MSIAYTPSSLPPRAKFDHILYSTDSLHCLDAKVLTKGASDHFPVVASFVIRAKINDNHPDNNNTNDDSAVER